MNEEGQSRILACVADECPTLAAWYPVIQIYAGAPLDPKAEKPVEIQIGLPHCEGHQVTFKIEDVTERKFKDLVEELFRSQNMAMPDWSRTRVRWIPISLSFLPPPKPKA